MVALHVDQKGELYVLLYWLRTSCFRLWTVDEQAGQRLYCMQVAELLVGIAAPILYWEQGHEWLFGDPVRSQVGSMYTVLNAMVSCSRMKCMSRQMTMNIVPSKAGMLKPPAMFAYN